MTLRLTLGISVVWLPLAFLFDGVTVLLLPLRIEAANQATAVGLISFAGLGLATLAQPIAGVVSDRLAPTVDRRRFMALASLPALAGLWVLAGPTALPLAVLGYVVLQVSASVIQAGQQALIPEHVSSPARGRAAGVKSLFDVGGSFLAFAVLGALLASAGVSAAAVTISVILVAALVVAWVLVPATPSSGSHRETREPGRWRSFPAGFWRLVASRFLFLVGIYAVGRFMLLLVADRLAIPSDRAAGEAGALLAAFTLTTALSAVAFGRAVDRVGRNRIMFLGVLIAGIGIAVLVPSTGVGGVAAGGFLMAIGTAAFAVANWAATTDLAPPADAGRLMAIANLGTGGAAAAAGLIGPLIDAAGFAPALAAAAAITLLAAVPLAGPLSRPFAEEPA